MKQITPEIKARVFALYWGRSVDELVEAGVFKLKEVNND